MPIQPTQRTPPRAGHLHVDERGVIPASRRIGRWHGKPTLRVSLACVPFGDILVMGGGMRRHHRSAAVLDAVQSSRPR